MTFMWICSIFTFRLFNEICCIKRIKASILPCLSTTSMQWCNCIWRNLSDCEKNTLLLHTSKKDRYKEMLKKKQPNFSLTYTSIEWMGKQRVLIMKNWTLYIHTIHFRCCSCYIFSSILFFFWFYFDKYYTFEFHKIIRTKFAHCIAGRKRVWAKISSIHLWIHRLLFYLRYFLSLPLSRTLPSYPRLSLSLPQFFSLIIFYSTDSHGANSTAFKCNEIVQVFRVFNINQILNSPLNVEHLLEDVSFHSILLVCASECAFLKTSIHTWVNYVILLSLLFYIIKSIRFDLCVSFRFVCKYIL